MKQAKAVVHVTSRSCPFFEARDARAPCQLVASMIMFRTDDTAATQWAVFQAGQGAGGNLGRASDSMVQSQYITAVRRLTTKSPLPVDSDFNLAGHEHAVKKKWRGMSHHLVFLVRKFCVWTPTPMTLQYRLF